MKIRRVSASLAALMAVSTLAGASASAEPTGASWSKRNAPRMNALKRNVALRTAHDGAALYTGASLDRNVGPEPTPSPSPVATSLSLSISSRKVTFGRKLTLTATFDSPEQGQIIEFYAVPEGDSEVMIGSSPTDATGRVSVPTRPDRETVYTAEFAGSDTLEPSVSNQRTVQVKALTLTKLFRYYAKDGRNKLYHAGKNPLFGCAVAPNHAGSPVEFIAQQKGGGSWVTIANAVLALEEDGMVGATLRGTQQGASYRIRCDFEGDSDHLGDTSPWSYIKITS